LTRNDLGSFPTNKKFPFLFTKPIKTTKILIKPIACSGWNENYHCAIRLGLVGKPLSEKEQTSQLKGTECAIVESRALHPNGGLGDDNEFIKAIKTRPTWDAYQRKTQKCRGCTIDMNEWRRNNMAKKYVATKMKF
jgi:hypothetical protein